MIIEGNELDFGEKRSPERSGRLLYLRRGIIESIFCCFIRAFFVWCSWGAWIGGEILNILNVSKVHFHDSQKKKLNWEFLPQLQNLPPLKLEQMHALHNILRIGHGKGDDRMMRKPLTGSTSFFDLREIILIQPLKNSLSIELQLFPF